ncbi:hypothetical protein [Sphingomonas sp. Y38-1Y]|uniref:hypothetical protein n=1 Tax=Sphingomonas sp. Y38-1Y TaxID=3078265 RepID=UPI0028E87852|nr:hypothetical protein [Sphingomonas sp. Y38-1Y]
MATNRPNFALYAAAGGVLAGAVGVALWSGLSRRSPADGHAAPDLAADKPHPGPDDRAPEHFRPNPTATVPPEDREALRPATGRSPTLVEDRGAVRSLP